MTTDRLEQATQLIRAGRIPDAISILEKLLQEDSNSSQAAFLLGVCHFRTQSFDIAESDFSRALSLNNYDHMAHYYLGLTLERQNKATEAEQEYRIALAMKPDFKEAQQKLQSQAAPQAAQPTAQPAAQPAETAGRQNADAPSATLARKLDRKLAATTESEHYVSGELLVSKHPRLRSYSYQCVFWFLIVPLILIFIKSRCTRYDIYERRIDIKSGVFFRKETSVWLFQVEETWYTRSPFNLLTRDATVHIRAQLQESMRGKPGHFKITGLGNFKQMRDFWQELRDSAIVERRAMKNVWV